MTGHDRNSAFVACESQRHRPALINAFVTRYLETQLGRMRGTNAPTRILISALLLATWIRKPESVASAQSDQCLCYSLPGNPTLLHVSHKGTDQPAHPRSLISAFVTHYLETRPCGLRATN